MWKIFHAVAAAVAAAGFLCDPVSAGAPQRCPGRSIAPARVITGQFGPEHLRSFVVLQRGTTIETVSSPIRFEPGAGAVVTRDCTPLRVRGSARRRLRPTRRGTLLTRCVASGGDLRRCTVRVVIRTGPAGRPRVRTLGTGRVRMSGGSRRVRVRLNRLGRRTSRRHRRGRAIRLVFTADDGDGATAVGERRARLLRAR